jgi:alpha-amylase
MPALSLCFQVHQPYRLRHFSFFDVGRSSQYFDIDETKSIMKSLARDVYVPAIAAVERVQARWGGEFRCSFYISGTAIEQMREFAPVALDGFRQLVRNPSVEILGGTYYHSLASLCHNSGEFEEQSELHREVLLKEFGLTPAVFFNAAQQHGGPLAERVKRLGYSGILFGRLANASAERSSDPVYHGPTLGADVRGSSIWVVDGAFYTHDGIKQGQGWTPTALMEILQTSVDQDGVICVLADCNAYRMHSGNPSTPSWLEQLVEAALRTPGWRFVTPSQALAKAQSLKVPLTINQQEVKDVAGYPTDLLGNSMQVKAFDELYGEPLIRQFDTKTWRRLQAADHFRNMSTLAAEDSVAVRISNPFESPYDAFITYRNVLRSIRHEAGTAARIPAAILK